ncbi:MAG TPA: SDR family oxidoreductase [Albitalea sp.]|uniref:SDR family oxidoreductase n=1 Tax=Piscinibacter sp. TaxID=1903157 RepID=UPI002ED6A353
MSQLQHDIAAKLSGRPRRWLVTGGAGFIGSHLIETLLRAGQEVVSLDNFATGHRANLDEVRRMVGDDAWSRHRFIDADIADPQACVAACEGVDLVLHQAALGSVPRSIRDPLTTHRANATGFLNMLVAARDAGAKRFVYAASSSTYGDSPTLPKVEDVIGRPLSPYAVTKYLNELYADVFGRCYGLATVGLRYFNVFGARQDPQGAYAAVIPRWVAAMLDGEPCVINGDGETSRDFCYVANAVQANLRAALVDDAGAVSQVYNVAVGDRTTLKQLHAALAEALQRIQPGLVVPPPHFADFRAGDVRHSLADIGKAHRLLGYAPTHDVRAGLAEAVGWYVENAARR